MTKVTKTALYNFLGKKRDELIKAKVLPLEKEISDMKDVYSEELLEDIGTEKFKKHLSEILPVLIDTRDTLDYSNYDLSRTVDVLTNIKNGYKYQNYINWDNHKYVFEKKQQADQLRASINAEFKKINSAIKSLANGKQGFDYLEDLGFDMSGVKEESKPYQLAVQNVDRKLLDLGAKKEVTQ